MHQALLPMSALLRRELLRGLRRTGLILSGMLIYVALVWIWYESWPVDVMLPNTVTARAGQVGTSLTMVYIAAVIIFVPVYSSMVIRSEVDRDTYTQLILTLLRPSAIIIGVFTWVLIMVAIMVASTFPVMLTADLISPLTITFLAIRFCMIISTACACAAAGLFTSTLRRKTTDIIGFSYAMAAIPLIIGYVIAVAFDLKFGRNNIWTFVSYTFTQISSTCVYLLLTIQRLRVLSFERISLDSDERRLSIRERWLQHVSRRPRSVYPDGRNPVFVREFGDALHRAQINFGSLMAAVVLSLALFGWTLLMVQSGDFSKGVFGMDNPPQTLQWYFVTTMLIAACTIPGISTPAWTNDRNSEMEEALDLTLLTRRERFVGRACAAAALPFIVTACWGVGFGPVLVYATKSASATAVVLIGAVALAATLFNLLALGRRIARTPLSTPAAVVVVHLIAIAYIGLPYMAMPRHNETATLAQLGITAISPFAAVICAVHNVRFQSAMGLYAYLGVFAAIQSLFFAVLAWGDVRPEWKTRKVVQ